MTIAQRMNIEGFLDASTSTMSYLLIDSPTGHCAIIDSVLEFDMRSGRTHTAGADRLIARVRELRLTVDWLLESHVHADHLSAAPYLQQHLGGKVAIGAGIRKVQGVFGALFNAGAEFAPDGSQFDKLLADGEAFSIGGLSARAIHTPGHTPACMTYLVTDGTEAAAFVGDTLFMPDYGTARCDFPGGDARTLFRSIAKLLALPPNTRLYMCHDYQPGGREFQYISTVAEQRATNIHVRDGIGEDEFVAMRTARDATLPMPALMLPSVQVNMRAGHLPEPEDNGIRYLKIPLNAI
ncbi:MBL fold metallo-hydrolase [Variovorax sp. VaC1]|uniref:MBL fold metallo-hydrolase n=1 Tax=Variovorax sp. VaC1 TaxID=3373132 RepID=UPI003748D8D8